MKLFIAEKPSLAKAIAEGLGKHEKQSGYFTCPGDTLVSWCYGHMFELANPDAYNSSFKQWKQEHLPIIPAKWKLLPRKDAHQQIDVLFRLLQKASVVVNAGDPDREGQLLVDELLIEAAYQGPVERIWLASLDNRSVAKALANLEDNAKYAPLRDAALARSRADWLFGINATRAMSILGRAAGYKDVLSLGRVQTPTLALVVRRDLEIEQFKPHDYFNLVAHLEHPSGNFNTKWKALENSPGLDEQGRLVDASEATRLQELAKSGGSVASVTKQEVQKAPPLPHCLSSLQKAASATFGMSAQAVLDIAQKLYEKKLTTYPRSDCRYLPEEQLEDASRVLNALIMIPEMEAVVRSADVKIKSTAWNTSKVTAHHGIIPTGVIPGELTMAESQIFAMICQGFCLQFFRPYKYESQKITVDLSGTSWEAKGRFILDPGWTSVREEEDEKDEKDDGASQALPAVGEGDEVACTNVDKQAKKTSPPSRFTEGTLIDAMANVHRFVDNASAKGTLKENEGIGTEATRASILETLKKRGFLSTDKKAIVSTQLGRLLVSLCPQTLKDPVTTASWESKLGDIALGKLGLAEFMDIQKAALPELLAPLLAEGAHLPPAYPCALCGKPMLYRAPEGKEPFWGCAAWKDGCKNTLPDDKGKPGKKYIPPVSNHKCPKCGQGMIRRSGQKGFFWACSAYPECRATCFDKEGTPDFSTCR